MCGFGDSWTKDHAQEQADAVIYEDEIELVEKEPAIILMVKNPELGKAKTRLAATIGEEGALKWYLYLLNHTREITRQVSAKRYLFYSSFVDENDEWSPDEYEKQVQRGDDLGQRMYNAFHHVFTQGHRRVIIIGSDCLDLRVHHLNDAFAALQKDDFVVGPAEDGGYYLLGMRRLTKRVFLEKAWSTEEVLPATLADFKALGKTWHELPVLSDVDREEDLFRSLERLEGDTAESRSAEQE